MKPCVIYLITQGLSKTSKGFNVKDDLGERKIFAEIRSVGRQEFYAAQHAGIRVDVVLRVRTADYNDERMIRLGDTTYDVIRTYVTGSDFTEISCARR